MRNVVILHGVKLVRSTGGAPLARSPLLSLAIRALVSIETNSLPLTAFYPSLALKWSHTKFESLAPRAVMSADLFIGGRMIFSLCEGFRHIVLY